MERRLFRNAKIVDVLRLRIFDGWFLIQDGRFKFAEEGEIAKNEPIDIVDLKRRYVVPGFIDAHMHVESSLVTCDRFAEIALKHGTVAVLQDPHEMANVFGADGVEFMIENAKEQPLEFYTAIPSCVPTNRKNLETPNAFIEPEDVERFATMKNVIALGEMMDYVGILSDDEKLLKIIQVARNHSLLIEGHCPTLKGKDLSKYIAIGVGSDHTLTYPEKIFEQLSKGMCVMIQEKSLTRENVQAILNLKDRSRVLLVTDDTLTTKLLEGHLNKIVSFAIKQGWDILDAIASATIRAASYLGLKHLGAIAPGKCASFFVVEEIEELRPEIVFCKGIEYERLSFKKPYAESFGAIFAKKDLVERDFYLSGITNGNKRLNVVICNDQNSFTRLSQEPVTIKDGFAVGDYVNVGVFHRKSFKGHVGLLKGFGMKKGAFASSFAHDSHNILVVGKSSEYMKKAVQELLKIGGGMVCCDDSHVETVPLEIGGIITSQGVTEVAQRLEKIERLLRQNGVRHKNPLTFLSVLSLTVSPLYKFSDLGIVDTEKAEILSNIP